MSIASWTSPAASGITFPISRAISSATSSFRSASSCPKRNSISPRFGAGVRRQSSYAALAASTARSTSSALDLGKTPSVSPVAGLVVSKVSPDEASSHSPPMKFLKLLVAAVAMAAILARRPRPDWRGQRIVFAFSRASRGWIGVRERPRRPCATPVADLAFAAVLAALATVVALAAVDDHRHVRVVVVVLDHLVVELGLELTRDHAIDHLFGL